MAVGSGSLEIIDPILEDPAFQADVRESLARAGVADQVMLHALRSPEAVHAISRSGAKRWAFAFIDGDHNGSAPLSDAKAVSQYSAHDAFILLHDLASPDVAAALDYLADNGWNTMIYQTMQIMGVAWKGNVSPVEHQPDPAQRWDVPAHLKRHRVSGANALQTIHSEPPEVVAGAFNPTVPDDAAISEQNYTELFALYQSLSARNRQNERQLSKLRAAFVQMQTHHRDAEKRAKDADERNEWAKDALLFHKRMLAVQQSTKPQVDGQTLRQSQLSDVIEWSTRNDVLIRLLRKRLTQSPERAMEVVLRKCSAHGSSPKQAESLAQWLTTPKTLRRLLRKNLLSKHGASKALVSAALGADPSMLNSQQLAQVSNEELTRLRALESAKADDERLISDLYVELAILRHKKTG